MNVSRTRFEPLREKTGFLVTDEYLTLHEEGRLRYGKDASDWEQNSESICLTSPPALSTKFCRLPLPKPSGVIRLHTLRQPDRV